MGDKPVWRGCVVVALLSMAACSEAQPPLAPPSAEVPMTAVDQAHAQQLIVDYGCIACHTVPGVRGPKSTVGPPLDKIALRGYIAGVLPNTPHNLVQWLLNPPSIDPRTAMPNLGMTDEDAKAVAAYLLADH